MRDRGRTTALGLLLLAAAPAGARQDKKLVLPRSTGVTGKDAGRSTVELRRYPNGAIEPHTRNVKFFTREDWTETDKNFTTRWVVFREEIEVEALNGVLEGWRQADVSLTATVMRADGTSKRLYRIESQGHATDWVGNYYVITALGCCGQDAGNRFYAIETGQLVMVTSGWFWNSVTHIEAKRAGSKDGAARWVGVATPNMHFDGVFGERRDGAVALLTYASETAPIMQVLVTFDDDEEHPRVRLEKLEVVTPTGPEGLSSLRVAFSDRGVVEVPLRGDALDVAHARLPRGATATLWNEPKSGATAR
jgi:hypothetical protein